MNVSDGNDRVTGLVLSVRIGLILRTEIRVIHRMRCRCCFFSRLSHSSRTRPHRRIVVEDIVESYGNNQICHCCEGIVILEQYITLTRVTHAH